jgi:hypothetical protein
LLRLSLVAFKALVRNQFFVLQREGERAIDALAAMEPKADARAALLKQVRAIISAGDAPNAGARIRLDRLTQLLCPPTEKPASPVANGRITGSTAPALTGSGLR